MEMTNVTIDDFDPVIVYSNYGDWQTPNPQENPTWWNAPQNVTNSPWHQATYHYTTVKGAKATLNFTGSAIAVYGATGPDGSNNYTITLDPSAKQPYTTARQTQNATEGRTLLYSTNELSNAAHQIEITNEGGGLLLDLVVVGVDIGQKIQNTTVDDRHAQISYDGAWTQQSGPNFHDETSSFTSGPNNSFHHRFVGTAVYVYGDQVNDHGEYAVLINGTDVGHFNGRSGCGAGYAKFCEKLHGLVFFTGGLPRGMHALVIQNLGPSEGNKTFFDFDYLETSVPALYPSQWYDAGDCPWANCSVAAATPSAPSVAPEVSTTAAADSSSGARANAVSSLALFTVLGAWAVAKFM